MRIIKIVELQNILYVHQNWKYLNLIETNHYVHLTEFSFTKKYGFLIKIELC